MSSYKEKNLVRSGPPPLVTSLNRDYHLTGPIFKYKHIGDQAPDICIWRDTTQSTARSLCTQVFSEVPLRNSRGTLRESFSS